MKQIKNTLPESATDEPASQSTAAPSQPATRVSDRLTESLIEEALEDARDSGKRPGSHRRVDGWTPRRIRIFLNALARCGVVGDAARAAGMSRRSAYDFRTRARGRPFDLAWRGACLLARRRIADDLVSRAIHGCVEVIVRDGQVWGERHRYDNRLTMAVLARLDEQARALDDRSQAARVVADEFQQFLDIACAGDNDAARAFIRRRVRFPSHRSEEGIIFERAENYARFGVGHSGEIDTHDLDPRQIDDWTEDQEDRAIRSGKLDEWVRLSDEELEAHFAEHDE